jgi:hypothetical protein
MEREGARRSGEWRWKEAGRVGACHVGTGAAAEGPWGMVHTSAGHTMRPLKVAITAH